MRTGFDSFLIHFSWKSCAAFKWVSSTLFSSSSDRHRFLTRSAQIEGLVRTFTVVYNFCYVMFLDVEFDDWFSQLLLTELKKMAHIQNHFHKWFHQVDILARRGDNLLGWYTSPTQLHSCFQFYDDMVHTHIYEKFCSVDLFCVILPWWLNRAFKDFALGVLHFWLRLEKFGFSHDHISLHRKGPSLWILIVQVHYIFLARLKIRYVKFKKSAPVPKLHLTPLGYWFVNQLPIGMI